MKSLIIIIACIILISFVLCGYFEYKHKYLNKLL